MEFTFKEKGIEHFINKIEIDKDKFLFIFSNLNKEIYSMGDDNSS